MDATANARFFLFALLPAGFFLGFEASHERYLVSSCTVPVVLIIYVAFCRSAKVEFGSQSLTWKQNLAECLLCGPVMLVAALPWSFAFQLADYAGNDMLATGIGYITVTVTACLAIILGTRSLAVFGGLACIMRGFAPFLAGWSGTPSYSPWLGFVVGVLALAPGYVRHRYEQCLMAMVPLELGAAIAAGGFFDDNKVHTCGYMVLALCMVYLQVLWIRHRRVLPPSLQGCKFVRLSYLRKIAASREGIRRCQDLPTDAFGDPTKARYLVVVSHRWMDRYTCDVRTDECPEGLRLHTMVKRFDRYFSTASLGEGVGLQQKWQRFHFALSGGCDVLIFFDFMSLPQVGQGAGGDILKRTMQEKRTFEECLPSMGVLYSMFPVMVCDEVLSGQTPYPESGWCFSESSTAWLGGQLSLLSADSPVEQLLNERRAATHDLQQLGSDLDELLASKKFLHRTDLEMSKTMIGGFVLKRRLMNAISSKSIDKLQSALKDIRDGCFHSLLDQPLDWNLNTPLHIAVAVNFTEGVIHLLEAGSNKHLPNLRGDTPVQWHLFPRLSAAARLCRRKPMHPSRSLPGASKALFQMAADRYPSSIAPLSRTTTDIDQTFQDLESAVSTAPVSDAGVMENSCKTTFSLTSAN